MRTLKLEGQTFGRLKVIEKHAGSGWLCLCICGRRKVANGHSLTVGKTKSCGCLHAETSRKQGLANRKHGGYSSLNSQADRTIYQALVNIRERAHRRGYETDLEMSDMPELTNKCPVLGIEYRLGSMKNKDYSPSIDRRNTNLPYLKKYKDNLLFISHRANRIKSDATPEEFERIIAYVRSCGAIRKDEKSSLIDSNAEMPTRAKAEPGHAERLSGETAKADAIVRSGENKNHQRQAEMTCPAT